MNLLDKLRPHAKAIAAFLTPAVVQLVADIQGGVTPREAARNIVVSVLTAVVVWLKANTPSDATQEIEAAR